jgi:hypothetical protein
MSNLSEPERRFYNILTSENANRRSMISLNLYSEKSKKRRNEEMKEEKKEGRKEGTLKEEICGRHIIRRKKFSEHILLNILNYIYHPLSSFNNLSRSTSVIEIITSLCDKWDISLIGLPGLKDKMENTKKRLHKKFDKLQLLKKEFPLPILTDREGMVMDDILSNTLYLMK